MVDEENTQYDVKVTNAFKYYGENIVINGLNMNIKSGSIYGLLGPSGCGKSTLLQCILGIIPLDSGCIDLKAKRLIDIGYMPQDLCLDETLTVQETFDFYGSLYKMGKKKINSRIVELSKFLQLPNTNSYIKDISGGQCRRVSLAISLLHDPKVIILDEPTVGIDPLLRNTIWNEFKKMSEEYTKTIIITTHYIEEANLANFIGLMRNGKLIEEGSPQGILCKYNTNSLESAFLTLCYNREINQIVQNDVQDNVRVKNESKHKHLGKFGNKIDYSRIKALLRKNIRLLSRDYFLIFTMFILPIIQSYNFCAGIGVDIKGKSIYIKNDEINYLNCQWSNVNGCIIDKESNQKMSCVVMKYLELQNYKLIQVNDRNDEEIMMKDPNHVAFIHFPKNYSKELVNFIDDRDNYDIKKQPYIHFTRHNVLVKNQFVANVINAMDHLMNITLKGCSNNPKSLHIPMEFNTIVGMEVKSYSNSLVSIYIATVALYLPSIFSVSIMLSERMDGILSRSMFAGVTALELLISMFCIINVLIVIQSCIPLFVIYVFFQNPMIISNGIIAYLLMIILLGWIGFFCGLLVAGLLPTKIGGVYIINGWLISQYLLSGVIWPVEGQSLLLRRLSELLPMRIAGITMTNITLKGWNLDHPSVVMGTTIMFAYVIVLVLVLIVLGKFKKDMWVIHK